MIVFHAGAVWKRWKTSKKTVKKIVQTDELLPLPGLMQLAQCAVEVAQGVKIIPHAGNSFLYCLEPVGQAVDADGAATSENLLGMCFLYALAARARLT